MLHASFKINGEKHTKGSLLTYAKKAKVNNEAYIKEIGKFLHCWLDNSSIIKVQTSGSTGKPKQIELQKQYMINSALATGKFFNCKEGTRALLCLPANFIAGKMMLVRAMVLGWDIYLTEPSSSPLRDLNLEFEFSAMVPMQVENSLQDLCKIKQLIIGGAPVSKILYKQLQQVSTSCYATYGMTETITHIAVKKLNNFASVISNKNKKPHYHILSGVTISKDNRDCLVIQAPKVSNETVVTNDIVELHSETSFEWLGRYDNVINSGGVKLFPEQIEEKLSAIIKNDFFISSLPDDKLGQKLILVVESSAKPNLSKQDFEQAKLSSYQIPKQVYSLPSFVRTDSGKIQRNKTLGLLK